MRKLSYLAFQRAIEPDVATLVESVVDAGERFDVEVYLVGGPVRDLLLDLPIRDVDLVVEPRGDVDAIAIAREAQKTFPGQEVQVSEFERFGTATLERGSARVDVATTRNERYPGPGVLPRVEPGTLDEDLRRRDFSINAFAWPLASARTSKTAPVVAVDEAFGDLQARKLRVLHERSFHDDPTRALRAARLSPRLGFALARPSRNALRSALRDGAFGAVSGDRFRREIEKQFSDARLGVNPAEGLRRLEDWHVLPALEPGLCVPPEAAAPLRRLGRLIAEPQWRGPRYRAWAAGLAVWLAPLSPALRRRALGRFSVRGELAKRLAGFPKQRDGWLAKLAKVRGRGAVDAVLSDIDEERLYALYAWANPAVRRRIVRWAAEDRGRRAPVTGSDLLELGLVDAEVGRALARIRSAHLDGAVANREEALALANELARSRRRRSEVGSGRRKRRAARPPPEG